MLCQLYSGSAFGKSTWLTCICVCTKGRGANPHLPWPGVKVAAVTWCVVTVSLMFGKKTDSVFHPFQKQELKLKSLSVDRISSSYRQSPGEALVVQFCTWDGLWIPGSADGSVVCWLWTITRGAHAVLSLLWLRSQASRSVKLLTFPGDWLQHWDASHQIAGVCHLRQEQEWLIVSPETSLVCVLVAFQAQLLGDFWLAFPSQDGWFSLPPNHQATKPASNSSCCFHCRLDYSSHFAVVMWNWAQVEAHSLPPVLLQLLMMMVDLFGFYFGLF